MFFFSWLENRRGDVFRWPSGCRRTLTSLPGRTDGDRNEPSSDSTVSTLYILGRSGLGPVAMPTSVTAATSQGASSWPSKPKSLDTKAARVEEVKGRLEYNSEKIYERRGGLKSATSISCKL